MAEVAMDMERAMARLPDGAREVFVLHDVEGYRHEEIAGMLGMAYIRVLEVATFYFMFQLQPVGSVAHVQVCGTTSCMICGARSRSPMVSNSGTTMIAA